MAETPCVVVVPRDYSFYQPRKLLPPSLIAVRVDNPPVRCGVYPVWTWSPDYVPVLGPSGAPESVDDPPFVHRGRITQTQGIIDLSQPPSWPFTFLGGGQPYAPRRLPPATTATPVDNPPFAYGGRLALTAGIVQSWQPPDPFPTQRGPLNPALSGVTVNNPPFSAYGRSALTAEIVQSWVPPDPPPVQRGPLNPSLTAVTVNLASGVGVPRIVIPDYVSAYYAPRPYSMVATLPAATVTVGKVSEWIIRARRRGRR